MKTIKLYDAWIQSTLIAVFILLSLINRDSNFLIGYFVVGAYQVVNTVIHALYDYKSVSKYRHYYNLTLIYLTVVIGIAFLVPYILFIVAYVMLFVSPLMAIAYNSLCFFEVSKLYERPLAQLK
jgi:hypothetical protein